MDRLHFRLVLRKILDFQFKHFMKFFNPSGSCTSIFSFIDKSNNTLDSVNFRNLLGSVSNSFDSDISTLIILSFDIR